MSSLDSGLLNVKNNYLKTVSDPFETLMKAIGTKQDCIIVMNRVIPVVALGTLTEAKTATMGRPFLVQYVKILGACPRSARP